MSDCGAVGRVALAAVDERMPVELVPHGRPHRARSTAVDDADAGQAGEGRVVDERPHRLPRLLRPLPAHVELVRHVTARHRHHLDRLLGLRLTLTGRTEAAERDPDALTGGADHLGVVAFDREDRAVDAELRRLDRVAGCERACERQRLIELPDRTLCARGPLRGGAETPVALRLVPSEPPGLPDLRAQRLELRPRLGEIALRVGGSTLAFGRR